VAVVLAAGTVAALFVRRHAAVPEVVRFQVAQPPKISWAGSPRLSPDGRFYAFDAIDETGAERVWLRAMDALEARPLVGTEGADQPFWSPDGRFIGFIAGGDLKKVAVAGGPPETICAASKWGGSGSWSASGTILFNGDERSPIRAVSAAGGEPTTRVPAGDGILGAPQFLPGGGKFLFGRIAKNGRLAVDIANADGTAARELLAGVSQMDYAPPGVALYVRDGTLLARRFEASTGRFTGEAIPVAKGLATDTFGNADFSVSRTGTLAFRTGGGPDTGFVWYDRAGHRSAAIVEAADAANFDLSPDGRWLLYDRFTPKGFRISRLDLTTTIASRFTEESASEMCPLFTRDGRRVLLDRGGHPNRLVSRSLDGNDERTLDESSGFACPEALTPDGETLIFDRAKGEDTYDLWQVQIDRPGSARPLIASKFSSSRASVSPDGRWLAFQGDESGRDEVYVTPLSGSGPRWQVSRDGGKEPEWSPSGAELFFVSPESRLFRVAVHTGATFDAGAPEPLFPIEVSPVLGRNRYLVSGDGKRFLVQSPARNREIPPVTIVLNWPRLVER
ncbi:MAG TPA: hypothetical protein VG777_05755, partial [Thermoanaerobaculia bacterium]|nr:hypothetical protein [Thermoanaerobaculia bacterium]